MALRPIFIPNIAGKPVTEQMIEFYWHAGFSKAQKQRNIEELHKRAADMGIHHVLEISTKSHNQLGVLLSAFNLMLELKDGSLVSVESAFQSSKVFEHGGPFMDLLGKDPRKIKKDERLKNSGRLIMFVFDNTEWNLEPKTSFYDWLYLNALEQNSNLSKTLINYEGFTDIEYNPQKQINCQARSAALFVSLTKQGIIKEILSSKDAYLDFLAKNELRETAQLDLFSTNLNEKKL